MTEVRTCKICTYGHRQFYISFGATRSRTFYKTEAGARRQAARKGYAVDPAPAQLVTPIWCDPTSETYWSM
jgi:hypothetical protein